jgi:hypothetical protein
VPAAGRVAIHASAKGVRFRLRVRPGARKSAVEGEHGGALKLSVQAPPDKGKANEEVRSLLAESLAVPRAAVSIVSGAGSRDKVVEIEALEPAEVLRRLGLA